MRGKRALAFSLLRTLQTGVCKRGQVNITIFIMFMIIVIYPGLSRGKTEKSAAGHAHIFVWTIIV
jgi:hypothetical protein